MKIHESILQERKPDPVLQNQLAEIIGSLNVKEESAVMSACGRMMVDDKRTWDFLFGEEGAAKLQEFSLMTDAQREEFGNNVFAPLYERKAKAFL